MKTGETFTYIPWSTASDDREMKVIKAAGFWSMVQDVKTGQYGIYNEKLRQLHIAHHRITGKRGGPYYNLANSVVSKANPPARIANAFLDQFR